MAIEFFYDVVSAYSYLASTQIAGLEARTGERVVWRPMFLGGLYQAVGNQMPAALPARARWIVTDAGRWAAEYGVAFQIPTPFPTNTLLALRALVGLPDDARPAASKALFNAYWAQGRDLGDAAVVTDLLGAEVVARASEPEVKAALKANGDEAAARGAFGAPTFFWDGHMFFGNDRLAMLERFVTRGR